MIGTVIDHKYQIVDEIGSGGMALVYRAMNLSNRRTVAIKMLKPEYKNDAEFLRRFSREAGTVLNLSHENIVRAYDVGMYQGLPYIVMEYVEGHTLKELIDQNGPLPVRTAIGITCQILDALTVAHQHGIIHRDVKPQNVIVTDRGKAKLTDFGIAREANASTSTYDGKKVLGSVHYISPEQAKNTLATEESDLYSVGVTLYEMLTGTVPFTSDSAVTIALMHIQDAPIPPKDLNPSIPPALNDIVMRALEKDAADRYAGARAMRADLVRSIGNPNGTFARDRETLPERPTKRRVSIYLLIGLCVFIPVAAIIAGIVVYSTSRQPTPSQNGLPSPTAIVSSSAAPTNQPSERPTVSSSSLRVPNVFGMGLDEALQRLNVAGYREIYVLFSTESVSGASVNSVIAQRSLSNEEDDTPGRIELTVFRASSGSYHADVSFTVSLTEEASTIRIVYETSNYLDIPYRVIVYEEERPYESTDTTIAATVYGYDPATRPLILLVNDRETATQSVAFNK